MDFDDAVETCRSVGGRLASERDLVELMTLGEVAGSDQWVVTSSFVSSQQANLMPLRIRWLEPTQYVGGSSDATTENEPQSSFRCMWTNELR